MEIFFFTKFQSTKKYHSHNKNRPKLPENPNRNLHLNLKPPKHPHFTNKQTKNLKKASTSNCTSRPRRRDIDCACREKEAPAGRGGRGGASLLVGVAYPRGACPANRARVGGAYLAPADSVLFIGGGGAPRASRARRPMEPAADSASSGSERSASRGSERSPRSPPPSTAQQQRRSPLAPLLPLSPASVGVPQSLLPPRLPHLPPPGLGLLGSLQMMHHASPLELMAAAHHHAPPRSYNSPPPISSSDPAANECKLVDYRGQKVAAFIIQGETMLCLPQAFELFLKHLVGGLHTVYTKLKRLDIVPLVCNVEQVRILRGLGAIQPGVNRCKLLSCKDFDVLYRDCTTARYVRARSVWIIWKNLKIRRIGFCMSILYDFQYRSVFFFYKMH